MSEHLEDYRLHSVGNHIRGRTLMPTCNTYWGSHGCGLEEGHDPEQEHPIHVCQWQAIDEDGQPTGPMLTCTQAQIQDGRTLARWEGDEDGTFGPWHDYGISLFRMDGKEVR